jgi:transposase
MVYRSISPDLKRRALQLLEEGWEMDEIANILSVSSKSIDRWHDNYETQGRVDPPTFLRGRRRILSADAITDLHELIQQKPELYPSLDEIRLWLAVIHGIIQISTSALHVNLRELGLTRKVMRRAAAERDHELRANWMMMLVSSLLHRKKLEDGFETGYLPK